MSALTEAAKMLKTVPGGYAIVFGVPVAGAVLQAGLGSRLTSDSYKDMSLYKDVRSEARDMLGWRGVKDNNDFVNIEGVGKVPIKGNAAFLRDYKKDKGRIVVSKALTGNPYVLAHELGHAGNIYDTGEGVVNKFHRGLAGMYMPARLVSGLTPVTMVGLAARHAVKGNIAKGARLLKKTPLYSAAAFAPVLMEEAFATGRGMGYLKDADPDYSRWKAVKSLGSAYGTYMLNPVVGVPSMLALSVMHPAIRRKLMRTMSEFGKNTRFTFGSAADRLRAAAGRSGKLAPV